MAPFLIFRMVWIVVAAGMVTLTVSEGNGRGGRGGCGEGGRRCLEGVLSTSLDVVVVVADVLPLFVPEQVFLPVFANLCPCIMFSDP